MLLSLVTRFSWAVLLFAGCLNALGDRVAHLGHPVEALGARIAAADAAENEIFLSTFIWSGGQVSDMLAAAFLRACDRGVSVRILIDGGALRLCDKQCRGKLRVLQEAGAKIHTINGLQSENWRNIVRFWRLANRHHDKVFLLDEHEAFVGSRNIWDNSFEIDGFRMREIDVRVQGNRSTSQMKAYADAIWKKSYEWKLPTLTAREHVRIELGLRRVGSIGEGPFSRVTSSPAFIRGAVQANWIEVGQGIEFLWDSRSLGRKGPNHIDRLEQWFQSIPSGRTLRIASPWIIATPRTQQSFDRLIQNGVRLELALNSGMKAEYMGGVRGFLEHTVPYVSGNDQVEVHLWQGRTLHFKVMTDGFQSYVGAYNIGFQSEKRNSETGLLIRSPHYASILEKEFSKIREGSTGLDSLDGANCAGWLNRLTVPFF